MARDLIRPIERSGSSSGREEAPDGREHRVRPLADQQVAAVGDHAERRPQAAGVVHPVRQGHPVVGRAPEAEAGAADAVEVVPRVEADERPPAERVSVCRAAPARNASAIDGVEAGRIGDAPPAERQRPAPAGAGNAAACGVTSAPGRSRPIQVTVSSPVRVAEEIPAAAARTSAGDGVRRCAPRRAGRRGRRANGRSRAAGSASSCSRTARTASARVEREPRVRGTGASDPEPPWPGSSGTITRRCAASAGAIRRQFEAAPPRPWTRTSGRPSPPTR